MTSDSVFEAERQVRARRAVAVAALVRAQRALRMSLIARVLLIAAFVINLPGALDGRLIPVIGASSCALVALCHIVVVRPRARRLVETRRSGLAHVQREYDATFERMIAFERGGPTALAELDERGPDRLGFYCLRCGGPGQWNGFDPHDLAVPRGHERQIVGDGEMWVVCHEVDPPDRWRYDPYEGRS